MSSPPTPTDADNGTDQSTRLNGQRVDPVVEIDFASEWTRAAFFEYAILKIQPITNRTVLKRIHTNIDTIYLRMENRYRASPQKDLVRGGIAQIVTQMVVDSVLRDKLFKKGVLDLIFPLLAHERTRQLGARALMAFSEHKGFDARHAISKKSNYLANLIRDSPNDYKLIYFLVTTLTRCMTSTLKGDLSSRADDVTPFLNEFVDTLPILEIILAAVETHFIRLPCIVGDVVDLFHLLAPYCRDKLEAHPRAIRFLVAGLRSKNWETRAKCFSGFNWVYLNGSCQTPETMRMTVLRDVFESHFPPHLNAAFYRYGVEECELVIAARCYEDVQGAISEFLQTEDFCVLGMKQAQFILRSEHSIFGGAMVPTNPDGPQLDDPKNVKTHWVFENLRNGLPLCAQALRERNLPGDDDMADILILKSLFLAGQLPDSEAVILAQKCIKRNPQQAFFYYIASHTVKFDRGFLAAKKGLNCPDLTPSLKFLLLERAICTAVFTANALLSRDLPEGDTNWKLAMAILTGAYEDAKTVVETAPPDSRLMKQVGYWLVMLAMVLVENLGHDFREIDGTLKKIAMAEEFWQVIKVTDYPETLSHSAYKFALENFGTAQTEFSAIFEALDRFKPGKDLSTPSKNELDSVFATWFNSHPSLEDEPSFYSESGPNCTERRKYHIEAGNVVNLLMYLCSWCSNPSAALRKCKGCGKVQYCNRDCQKSDWPYHKKDCKHRTT